MESFNFGAFDPTIGARIAAIPQEAQKQQTANMLQAMQMQGAMRQNEMSQMQLDEMKTDRAEMVKLQQDLAAKGGSPDLGQYADMLMRSPKHMKLGIELKQKLNAQARYAEIMGRTAPAAAPVTAPMAPTIAPEPGSFGADVAARRDADPFARPPERNNMMPGAVAAPAGVNAMVGGGANNAAQIAFKQQQRDALIGEGTTQSIAAARAIDADIALLARPPQRNLAASPGQTIYGPAGEIVAVTPEKPLAPPSMVAEYTFAKTPDGGSYKGSFADFKRLNRPAASASAGGASTGKPLTALQERKAKETEVAQRSVVKSADTAATELETLADTLLGNPSKKIQPHPGLGGITGFMSVLPSMPESEARSAQQKLDTFKGKVMAFGRLLAVQQGKLGNMAVSEWKFISDAIEKIDPAANNFNDQLRDVVRQAKDFAAAKRETFDELYDSTMPTGAPTKPSAAVAPALTSADQQALDWASANPKDPRATQIKKRLGRD